MTTDIELARIASGGFDATDAAQGWSAEADWERAAIDGPLPPGGRRAADGWRA